MRTLHDNEIGAKPLPTWLREEGQVHVAVITTKDSEVIGSSGALGYLSAIQDEVEAAGGAFDITLRRGVVANPDGSVTEYVIDPE